MANTHDWCSKIFSNAEMNGLLETQMRMVGTFALNN